MRTSSAAQSTNNNNTTLQNSLSTLRRRAEWCVRVHMISPSGAQLRSPSRHVLLGNMHSSNTAAPPNQEPGL